jgi:hypothetical protein
MQIFFSQTIYGIVVYRFRNSGGVEFQLTFEKNLSSKYVDVRLINLTGQSNSVYCKSLRQLISNIIYDYLNTHNCILFFNIKLDSNKGDTLLIKFLRWIELEDRVKSSLIKDEF